MAISRWAGATPTTLRSAILTSPSLGSSRPAIILSKVDLPQPDAPTKIKNSPGATSISIFFKTSTALSPLPNTLRIPLMCNADAIINSSLTLHRTSGKTFNKILSSQDIYQQGW